MMLLICFYANMRRHTVYPKCDLSGQMSSLHKVTLGFGFRFSYDLEIPLVPYTQKLTVRNVSPANSLISYREPPAPPFICWL